MPSPVRLPDAASIARAAETALRGCAPAGVRTGVRTIDAGDLERLFPDELEQVRSARDLRRREYATGRVLLRQLTGVDQPIVAPLGRPPALASGWHGSLAHDRWVAIAVAAPLPCPWLGVDLEPRHGGDESLGEVVFHPDDPPIDPVLAWVVKEATFKAWSALAEGPFDPALVRLDRLGPDGSLATTMGAGTACADHRRFVGRWAATSTHWLAVVHTADEVSRGRGAAG